MTFKEATAQYVHRYTMDHVPNWARQVAPNGKYYAPQFASDEEWFANTLFPPHQFQLSKRDKHCFTTGQTWPLGQWLDEPYSN